MEDRTIMAEPADSLTEEDVYNSNEYDIFEKEMAIFSGYFSSLLRQRFSLENATVGLSLKFLDFRYQRIFENVPLEIWTSDCRTRVLSSKEINTNTSRIAILIERLKLSSVDLNLLLMAGLAEEHEGFADIFRSLHPIGLPRPTMGLAAQFCESQNQQQDLSSNTPNETLREQLRTHTSINSEQHFSTYVEDSEQPFFNRNLCVIDGLWSWLHGVDTWPEQLPILHSPAVMAGLDHWLTDDNVKNISLHLQHFSAFNLLISSDHIDCSINRAAALCQHAGVNYRLVKLDQKNINNSGRVNTLQLLQIHCLIRDVVPIIPLELFSAADAEKGDDNFTVDFSHFFSPVIFCCDSHNNYKHTYISSTSLRPLQSLEINALDTDSLRTIWRTLLPELSSEAEQLAARYPFEPHLVQRICIDVRHFHAPILADTLAIQGTLSLGDIAMAVRCRSGNGMAGGLQLIHPISDWSQLVLPEQQLQQLQDAANRLSLQSTVLDDWKFLKGKRGSRGVRMLFSGPPGTGKTLSAEVMANALGVDVLQVDLSKVVSKWLGETEKNLSEIFNAAESTRAVLFFDEADSLFGKRTEVSDAHDRYANLETSYLLSRLERYDGLAILATNYRQNIDIAFSRRLEFIIEFAEPGVDERQKLWQCHIPESAPLSDDVNLSELAMLYPITGGHIRNAAVSAAFLAAQDQEKIKPQHLIAAIKREYEKSGKAYREVSRR